MVVQNLNFANLKRHILVTLSKYLLGDTRTVTNPIRSIFIKEIPQR